jgi:hypothetical protein
MGGGGYQHMSLCLSTLLFFLFCVSHRYATERLRDDKDVVLSAVNADREVIKFASQRLRNDRDVVAAATVQVVCCLLYSPQSR